MKITAKLLRAKGACDEQVALFERLFPDGVVPTEQVCLAVADKFDWTWAARHLLSLTALAEFVRVESAAWADYERIESAALADYERITEPALAEFVRITEPARAEFVRVKSAALADYWRVKSAAWAEYKRVKAATFGRLAARARRKGRKP